MHPLLLLVAVPLIGVATALALTPLVRRVAETLHLVDRPDCHRKIHDGPVPLGGGVAILLAVVTATVAAVLAPHPWQPLLWHGSLHLVGLFIAAVVVTVLGLTDDLVPLGGRPKMLGQTLAALVVVLAGLQIERIQFFDWQLELGVLAVPFTLFWILGAINALNLLDGSDGVATTVGIILSLSLAAMALMLPNREIEAVVALALAGSLAGFLFYNFPPASIYLGDAGSMLIGLIIGVLALRSGLKGPATIALVAPTALFAIPILDTGMAILRRKLTGRSVYTADRGHLHHCLLRRGLSSRRTLLSIAALSACTCVGALASVYRRDETLALIGASAVVGTLIVTRYFGHPESRILTSRLAQIIGSFLPTSAGALNQVREERFHIAGGHRWDTFWTALVELGDRFGVSTVRLNLTIPAHQDEFHAFRCRHAEGDPTMKWSLDLPLVVDGMPIGRLQLRGYQADGNCQSLLSEFLPMLNDLLSSISFAPRSHSYCLEESDYPREPNSDSSVALGVQDLVPSSRREGIALNHGENR